MENIYLCRTDSNTSEPKLVLTHLKMKSPKKLISYISCMSDVTL